MGKQANNQTERLEIIASRSDMYREKIGKHLELKVGLVFREKLQTKKENEKS